MTVNVDPTEITSSATEHCWWDPTEFRPLHEINPAARPYRPLQTLRVRKLSMSAAEAAYSRAMANAAQGDTISANALKVAQLLLRAGVG
jgi:hypothetical protein